MISSEKQVIQHYVDTLLVKAVAELEERVVEQIKPNFFSHNFILTYLIKEDKFQLIPEINIGWWFKSGKKVEINNSLDVEDSLFKEPKDFWKHHSQELDDKFHILNNYRNLPSVTFTEGAELCLKLFEMQIQYLELLQKGE